ncbi:uncharacterized protein HGUI_01707 [Hanseniaspora guilliermondii]|uniref:Cyclin N-terminal domain-containing protein n=1 Tax=Hanseniaspora guilliermondii TaxID=56406 RepID=A0A1L0B3H8_9ASCO|nr:uncharacterized protein HGUI_01707 [Hanseniaspora guilliermondii]
MFAPNGYYYTNSLMNNGYNPSMHQQYNLFNQSNISSSYPPGLGHIRSTSMSLADKPKVVGGVCEVLDYDIKYMTHFVVEHSLITCGKILNDSDEISGVSSQVYKQGIEYVLNATRLPRSTIYIALNYLHSYVHKSKLKDFDFEMIYQHVITSLILGNKFNDDKMFANKTWSTASGIDLKVINKLEIDFLKKLDYNLNDSSYSSTYDLYDNIFMDIVVNLTTKAQIAMNYSSLPSQTMMQGSNDYLNYYQPQFNDYQQMNSPSSVMNYYTNQNMGNYTNYQNMQHYYNNQSYGSLSPSFF